MITVPPPGDLALVPDGQVLRPPRLDDLDALGWSEVSDAGIVAVTGHPPRPHTWSVQARKAVEATVPVLLARWEIEPPANRFALTVLVGAFPSQGQVLAERVAALATNQAGTRVGICAQVARPGHPRRRGHTTTLVAS
jgi:hypothetical protein